MVTPAFDKDDIFKEWSEHFLAELGNTQRGLDQIKNDLATLRVSVRKFKIVSAIWGFTAGLLVIALFFIFSSNKSIAETKPSHNQFEFFQSR